MAAGIEQVEYTHMYYSSSPGDAHIHCSPWSVATAPEMAILSHDPLPGRLDDTV